MLNKFMQLLINMLREDTAFYGKYYAGRYSNRVL